MDVSRVPFMGHVAHAAQIVKLSGLNPSQRIDPMLQAERTATNIYGANIDATFTPVASEKFRYGVNFGAGAEKAATSTVGSRLNFMT